MMIRDFNKFAVDMKKLINTAFVDIYAEHCDEIFYNERVEGKRTHLTNVIVINEFKTDKKLILEIDDLSIIAYKENNINKYFEYISSIDFDTFSNKSEFYLYFGLYIHRLLDRIV